MPPHCHSCSCGSGILITQRFGEGHAEKIWFLLCTIITDLSLPWTCGRARLQVTNRLLQRRFELLRVLETAEAATDPDHKSRLAREHKEHMTAESGGGRILK